MALSNLIWWPWFGIGEEEPPAEGPPLLAGDRRVHSEMVRRRPPSEDPDPDEEALIAFVLSRR